MKVSKFCAVVAICLGITGNALANNVLVTSVKPIDLTYHVARVNGNNHPIFGELRTMKIIHSANIDCALKGYERSGMVIVAVNGRALPDTANQFNQPRQCSMTTDAAHPTGAIEITTSEHAIKCASTGGVFG